MGSHVVRWKDMRPGCRLVGCVSRAIMPPFSERSLRWKNRLLDAMHRGRWPSRKTYVETYELTRPDGSSMRVVVCRSRKVVAEGPLTGVLWIHGGAMPWACPRWTSSSPTFCAVTGPA